MTEKENLEEFLDLPLGDEIDYIFERGLLYPQDLEVAKNGEYTRIIWENAYLFVCFSELSGNVSTFTDALEDIIDAGANYDYKKSNSILENNPQLKSVYWITEKHGSAFMHNQILRAGREMIKRKYQL